MKCGRGVAARGQNLNRSREEQGSGKPPRAPAGGRDVGAALKKAYDGALGEEIPTDLLDLLRKLD